MNRTTTVGRLSFEESRPTAIEFKPFRLMRRQACNLYHPPLPFCRDYFRSK
jgi:hypothetical protein